MDDEDDTDPSRRRTTRTGTGVVLQDAAPLVSTARGDRGGDRWNMTEPRPWTCNHSWPPVRGCAGCGEVVRAWWIEVKRATAESHANGRHVTAAEIEASLDLVDTSEPDDAAEAVAPTRPGREEGGIVIEPSADEVATALEEIAARATERAMGSGDMRS